MGFNRINTEEQVFAKPAVQLHRCTSRIRCFRAIRCPLVKSLIQRSAIAAYRIVITNGSSSPSPES
jgi:hypothetical protein